NLLARARRKVAASSSDEAPPRSEERGRVAAPQAGVRAEQRGERAPPPPPLNATSHGSWSDLSQDLLDLGTALSVSSTLHDGFTG
ncbi:MAG: hypothetical protein OXI73_02200, partial [Rhodospirillales bacterium]|nr:hypothetical protein [Rhodospirillales bacterium]